MSTEEAPTRGHAQRQAWERWREYDADPAADLPRILGAALVAFAEHGYHGTSIRDVAAASGLSVPGVYHHFRSKQEILRALMDATMDELLGRCEAALRDAGADPAARFDSLVESFVRFHMFRRPQAFVGSSEIRSLEADNRAAYVARRDAAQRLLEEAVAEGVAAGGFSAEHPDEVARAISSLCVGVASWYRPDGPLTPDQLVQRHLVLARRMAGAPADTVASCLPSE
ncbi:TetR/AcrR family transcriptional regulator [uncultured Nocardioides sp.]|nr:TetR/AcrR family transcriptional regulator [uncultured Nocardioides sp.]